MCRWRISVGLITVSSALHRMKSTEKCEVIIQHFNGKYLKSSAGVSGPSEPLLCKFADGRQKKRQTHSKHLQNGRVWREGEMGMTMTYEYAIMQNGLCSSPFSITANQMIAQTSVAPFITASPLSAYQGVVTEAPSQNVHVVQLQITMETSGHTYQSK